MKRKILTLITIGSISLMMLTGCAEFSYGNPAQADTVTTDTAASDEAELSDDPEAEMPQEEEIGNIPEEPDEPAEASEKEEASGGKPAAEFEEKPSAESQEETEEAEEESEEEAEEEFNIETALGERIGSFKTLGVNYVIYANGAEITGMDQYSDSTILEEIEYEGVTYPIVSLACLPYNATEFEIPSHIKYIRGAFKNSGIKTVTIPDTIEYMECNGTFAYCRDLESITFSGTFEMDTTKWIDTFRGCSNLQAVAIPESVTALEGTFMGCGSMTSVSLPEGLERIGYSAFDGCGSLTEINIPATVASIGAKAFSNTAIRHIEIPESVESLCLSAFSNCSELEELIIPDTVTHYTDEYSMALSGMDSLRTLIFSNNCEQESCMLSSISAPKLELVVYPDNLKDLSTDMFYRLEDKSSLTIQVPEYLVNYIQNKYPECNVVAKTQSP